MEQTPGGDANPYRAPVSEVLASASGPRPFVPGGRRVDAGSSMEWLKESWRQFASNPLAWYGVLICLLVASSALGAVPLIGSLLSQILTSVLAGGIALGCERRRRGGHFLFADLFTGFQKHLGQLALLGAVFGIAFLGIIAVALIVAGVGGLHLWSAATQSTQLADLLASSESVMLIMLIVLVALLGAFLLGMGYWFAPALIVLYDQPAFTAIGMSFKASLTNFWPLFVFSLLLVAVTIVAAIPFGLGMLVLMPMFLSLPYASAIDVFESPAA